jgi:primase-polymerase (primpol)-like protein
MARRAATAAAACAPAIFIAPHHVTIQTVLRNVGAFKLGAFDRRDHKHAHEHGGQRKKWQQQHERHETLNYK